MIEQLGYVPDGAAQSLSRRRKEIIGLVSVERVSPQFDIENMSLLFYDEVLHGVEGRLREHGWSLLITFLKCGDLVSFDRLLSLSGKVDGLLIGEGIVPSPLLARVAMRVPVVVIAGAPDEKVADVVAADNRSGSAALVRHLIEEHDRRSLFHVDGPPTAPDARERRLAIEQVVAAHPRTQIVGSYRGIFSAESGERAAEAMLAERRHHLPDAVVCANDQMAIGVLQALSRAGISVPEHIAVVGFDDIYPGNLSDPPLTTVHQPMRLLGERACSRLLDRIAQPDLQPRVELLPTELVIRASCGCTPASARRSVVTPLAAARPRRRAIPSVVKPARRPAGKAR
ncbi:MAG: transcriptional regulator, LacI family [Acidimicrobiaceae bacterium]|nr:transcriptional regulator, LacI family [Acidimicrobiaceae bacterium]